MKPRLKKRDGLWYCYTVWIRRGIGFTPLQAYDDWLHLELKS